MKPKILVIIAEGVEELEATAPIDILRRAEATVTVASASQTKEVTGRNGIRLVADNSLEEIAEVSFDMIVIPGGPAHKELLENDTVLSMIAGQKAKDGWIASICAGPVVLKKAGVLQGKRFTSFPGTSEELPERIGDQPVVVDGKLITSQGAGTAVPFALALVEALYGSDKSREIAESICYPG